MLEPAVTVSIASLCACDLLVGPRVVFCAASRDLYGQNAYKHIDYLD